MTLFFYTSHLMNQIVKITQVLCSDLVLFDIPLDITDWDSYVSDIPFKKINIELQKLIMFKNQVRLKPIRVERSQGSVVHDLCLVFHTILA